MSNYDKWFVWGRQDCGQDACENVPFASIGGLESRLHPILPKYVKGLMDEQAYLQGYCTEAFHMYGKDWQICQFGWQPALIIN